MVISNGDHDTMQGYTKGQKQMQQHKNRKFSFMQNLRLTASSLKIFLRWHVMNVLFNFLSVAIRLSMILFLCKLHDDSFCGSVILGEAVIIQ